MKLNAGFLVVTLIIGLVVGLALNPYLQTPLNPPKEVTVTSSTTLTSTSTTTTTQITTETQTRTSSQQVKSTVTATATATTTVTGSPSWDRWGIHIKPPTDIITAAFNPTSDEKTGLAQWRWDDFRRELDILWQETNSSIKEESFQGLLNSTSLSNAEVRDKGQVTIDNHTWDYQVVRYVNPRGQVQYMVNAISFYKEKSISYLLIYDTPNSEAVKEMMTYASTLTIQT
ncbi:MAG: hypothetical protein M1503_07720 [Thaumarchaeota archaeon]|nr:hypothetical protein [Nitrososphaerota archaeon]MCL5318130.1 hypothetical protein [Nitrososphaerota archaeon]